MNELIEYKNTDNIVKDACKIIDSAQKVAYKAVNSTLVIRNWLLGKRICEEELKGEKRAEYGNKLISLLADELTKKYGKGFTRRTLYNYIQFYKLFPQIVRSLTTQSTSITSVSSNRHDSTNSNNIKPITHSLLSWTHYEKLLQVDDENARS